MLVEQISQREALKGGWSLVNGDMRWLPFPERKFDVVIAGWAIGHLRSWFEADWQHQMMLTSTQNVDPMMTVLREGGPFHSRGRLPAYMERLRATGRVHHAETLAKRHPDEV